MLAIVGDSYHKSDDELSLCICVECLYEKYGTNWFLYKQTLRTINPCYNKVTCTVNPGVINFAKYAKSEIDTWYLFYTSTILCPVLIYYTYIK